MSKSHMSLFRAALLVSLALRTDTAALLAREVSIIPSFLVPYSEEGHSENSVALQVIVHSECARMAPALLATPAMLEESAVGTDLCGIASCLSSFHPHTVNNLMIVLLSPFTRLTEPPN